jgi:hypothetical protein
LACSLCATVVFGQPESNRETKDLVVLYTFERAKDNVIRDRAGTGAPLDLRIETPQGIAWRSGRMQVLSNSRLTSTQPASKIAAAIKKSGELTIEAWIKPADNKQAGPARIVTLSSDPGQRNFTLGQDATQFDVRLRTSATDANGIPSTSTPKESVRLELTHVIFTRNAAGSAKIYVDGKERAAQQVAGDLRNWKDDFHLSIANELTGDRPWLGEIQLVAIYGRALAADEVARNFAAGAPPARDYAALLPPAAARQVDFLKDVQPILRTHCYECHSGENEEGGLTLAIRQRVLEGGDTGSAVIKGDSANSPLIHRVAALEKDEAMPPGDDRLSAEQVGILRAWIDQGLAWPQGAEILDPRLDRAQNHWAFQPLHDTPAPSVKNADWCRTPIDRFILARLETTNLQPAEPADAQQLCRRIYFDLIGLPPSPDEMQEFCTAAEQNRPTAIESLVDRLLASRHFGERWGRHWLDIARYADSSGYESDHDRPNAWRYRDFVIRAHNQDMPFDQFVRWQLAGDEYEPQHPEALAATGFLAAGPGQPLPDKLLEDERLRQRYNELDDMLQTIGTGMLGLTLGCARCHDHKYDAIPARDYYRLMAALHSGDRTDVPLGDSKDKAFGYRDFGPQPKPTWLFKRADFYDHRHPVELGFVTALTRGKSPEEYWQQAREHGSRKDTTYQRRALAEWITDTEQGAGALLARVIVNRIWQHHFGQPLVNTVGDFGVRSEAPTHPELLEFLAHDLVQNGWKLHRLHRMMLTSSVYQQTSTSPARPAADPDNRLLWKMRRQRLEAEILRDTMLVASGTLNREAFGPAFKSPIPPEAMLARNVKDPYPSNLQDSPAVRRRSIYMFHKRVVPSPLLQAFDKPDAQQSCGRRDQTTVAPQALALLNDPFVRTVSQDFAERLLKESGNDASQLITRAYHLALARGPTPSELKAATDFLETQTRERASRMEKEQVEEARRRAVADFCQTMFSLNEFIYVD